MLAAADITLFSIGDHQRDYLYQMSIIKDPVQSGRILHYSDLKDKIDLYNIKGIWPERKTSRIEIKWAGETYSIPGTDASSKEGTLSFRCTESHYEYEFWRSWQALSGDEYNHSGFPKSEIIFDMLISQISVSKSRVTGNLRLQNCQILSIGEMKASKDGSDVSQFDVGLCWDRSFFEKGGQSV